MYLYQEKWDSAEVQANKVIENPDIQLDTTLQNTFTSSSKEAIWQVEPPYTGFDAPDGFWQPDTLVQCQAIFTRY